MAQLSEKEILEVYIHEYDKIKDEQIHRIGFRDNMVYVNLVAVGAVASFAATGTEKFFALLLIPWVCTVLGWTYLVNDEKISSLGRYIRLELEERIRKHTGAQKGELFGWEIAHRSDPHRQQRKFFQLIVDLLTFCLIGMASVGAFLFLANNLSPLLIGISIVELILLIILGYQIVVYADLKRGR